MNGNEKDIGNLITQALSSAGIRKYIELTGDISESQVVKIIQYCVITRSSEIPQELLDGFNENIEGSIIIKSVAKILGIDETDFEKRGNEIFEFVYNNLITNGVAYHMTNSVIAEEINKTGLKSVSNTNMSQDIKNVARKMKNYNRKIAQDLFPYVSDEIDHETGVWYCNKPKHIAGYFCSPEWLKEFCSGTSRLVEGKETRHAFAERDYDSVIRNINLLIEKYGIKGDDAGTLIEFFNKYWKKFERATPTLVLIPQECLGESSLANSENFIKRCNEIREGYVDTSYSDFELSLMQMSVSNRERIEKSKKEAIERKKQKHSSIYYKINELLKEYDINASGFRTSESTIDPQYLSYADMSELVQKEKYMFTLKTTKESGMLNWDEIVKKSLKMVEQKDLFDEQYIEDVNLYTNDIKEKGAHIDD